MAKAQRLSADQRSDLVAYLDGELEDAESKKIDQILSQSEVARHEVEVLARTWEMLDLLPRFQASGNFTERTLHTLKTVKPRLSLKDLPWAMYKHRTLVLAIWLIGIFGTTGLGWWITAKAIPNPHARLLADLPFVQHVNIYREVGSVDFANELKRLNLFDEEDPVEGKAAAIQVTPSGGSDLKLNQDKIDGMAAPERAQLKANWASLESSSAARLQAYRALHAEMEKRADVFQTVQTYWMWLQTLTPGQRQDLSQMDDIGKKIELVRRFYDEQQQSRQFKMDPSRDFVRLGRGLRTEVSMPAYQAFLDMLEATIPPNEVVQLKGLEGAERHLKILRMTTKPKGNGATWPDPTMMSKIKEVIVDFPREFPPNSPPEVLRRRVVLTFFNGFLNEVAATWESNKPTQEDLQKFFENELSSTEREQLMQEHPDDARRKLAEMYIGARAKTDPKIGKLIQLQQDFRAFVETFDFGMRGPNGPGGPPFGPGGRGPFRGDRPRMDGQGPDGPRPDGRPIEGRPEGRSPEGRPPEGPTGNGPRPTRPPEKRPVVPAP